MEEATVKKEIIVKRLSAFKFAVEVNTKESNTALARESVIQRAPPASPAVPEDNALVTAGSTSSETILIRHAIVQRIVEMLLWKLLGRDRLRTFCGYPATNTCALLRRALFLSSAGTETASECDGSMACFLDQVGKFLKMCAPDEALWNRFGWNRLSEEGILRKIYGEELSPNVRPADLQQDPYMMKVYNDIQLLLHWEQHGLTAVSWRPSDKHISPLPRPLWVGRKTSFSSPYPPPQKLVPRCTMLEDSVGWTSRSDSDDRRKIVDGQSRISSDWSRPTQWTRHLRPYRLGNRDHGGLHMRPAVSYRVHSRPIKMTKHH